MAGEIRKFKTRINATKKTSQITKAMHMVSASKLRSAELAIKQYRPFINKVREIIVNIASSSEEFTHPLMNAREINKICYVVITSDRGLAGAFNSNVLKELTLQINKNQKDFCVLPVGFKAYQYTKKMKYPLLKEECINIRDDIEFTSVEEIIKLLVDNYMSHHFDQVIVIANHLVNTLIQTVTIETILPIQKVANNQNDYKIKYEFDGGVQEILDTALPIYIENYIYSFILDSKASEHAARMNSMQNATDNAMEVIASLELLYNRARQAAITLEITDIVGGASVVNEN